MTRHDDRGFVPSVLCDCSNSENIFRLGRFHILPVTLCIVAKCDCCCGGTRSVQPALTKAIQRLEAEVGVRLFTRDRFGMRPTLHAEMLRPCAEAVTSGLTQTLAKIKTSKSGERSSLRVSGAPHKMEVLFPKALVKLKQQLPNLQLRVVTTTRDLIAGLIDGEYDLAVTALDERIGTTKLNRHFLFNDRLVIATRPNHPLSRFKKITPEILKDLQWIYSGEPTWHRRRLDFFSGGGNHNATRVDRVSSTAGSEGHHRLQRSCRSCHPNGSSLRYRSRDAQDIRNQILLLWRDQSAFCGGRT